MQFFSGFSLINEESFFEAYLKKSDFNVCGFSYGAIKAFEKAKKLVAEGKRVDTLQLFSPAFFQTKAQKFKRLQLLSYTQNSTSYLEEFIKACFLPYCVKNVEQKSTTKEELNELLQYEWPLADLVDLVQKGVVIEVYLGSEDRIVDAQKAKEFFLDVATVTYIKNANHFLQTE
ncbi:pimelyl-ACP methyl ester esterase BioV [Sulfurimonas sp.]